MFQAGPAPTLNSIAVTPANPSIGTGVTQQFTATGSYSDGSTQNMTSQATWTSSSPSVATIRQFERGWHGNIGRHHDDHRGVVRKDWDHDAGGAVGAADNHDELSVQRRRKRQLLCDASRKWRDLAI